jgi:hypothetical protein
MSGNRFCQGSWLEVLQAAGLTMPFDSSGVCHYTEALDRTAMDVWDDSV